MNSISKLKDGIGVGNVYNMYRTPNYSERPF